MSMRASSFGEGEHSQRWLFDGVVGDQRPDILDETAADRCLLLDWSGAQQVRSDEATSVCQGRQVQRALATTLQADGHQCPVGREQLNMIIKVLGPHIVQDHVYAGGGDFSYLGRPIIVVGDRVIGTKVAA